MDASAGRILAATRDLAPRIAARAPEIEAARRLPLDLVAELRAAGFFRMLVPRSHGGLEVAYPHTIDVIAGLAAADGATGWTVMIGCESPQLFALLSRKGFDDVYSAGPDVVMAGAFAPQGRALPVTGGHRVTGRWGFASGCQHADWIFGHCVVGDGAAVPAEGAPPTLVCTLLPAKAWTIHDTWHTAGLRGTGSQDIELADAFAPELHSFVLFGGMPSLPGPIFVGALQQASLHIAAVALGIAEGALADLVEFAATRKRRLYGPVALPDSPIFQHKLGHAEADAFAARALLKSRAEELWAQACGSGTIEPAFMVRVIQTSAWVAETAARVVDVCYTVAGGSALYESSPLQRRLRDIHTLTQHASLQDTVFATAGAVRLGRPGSFGL